MKKLIILSIIIVVLMISVFIGRYFLFPMMGHPLTGMWAPVSNEQTQIGSMVMGDFTWLSFESRGRGGIVSAETPSAHDYRFIWRLPMSRHLNVIRFSDYPRYDRPSIGVFHYGYEVTDENLLTLIPVCDNFEPIGEELVFRRIW